MDSNTETEPCFPGDTGELTREVRQVLVNLIKGPSIDGRQKGGLWSVLINNEALVRSRLHELFLDLNLDRDSEFAYTRQIELDDMRKIPSLLRREKLTFYATVLILFLRGRLSQADAQGDRAVVSDDEMHSEMVLYRRDRDSDHSRFRERCESAIVKLRNFKILRSLEGIEARYEVNPALKLIFSADQIRALTKVYQDLLADPRLGDGLDDESSDEDEAEE
jgi:hypothetical protein